MTTSIETMNGMTVAKRWNAASADGQLKHSTMTGISVKMNVGNWPLAMNVIEAAVAKAADGRNSMVRAADAKRQSIAHVKVADVAMGRVVPRDDQERDDVAANAK